MVGFMIGLGRPFLSKRSNIGACLGLEEGLLYPTFNRIRCTQITFLLSRVT
jgi:hypothetical protein